VQAHEKMRGGAVDIVVLKGNVLCGGEMGKKGGGWFLCCDVCEERFSGGLEGCTTHHEATRG
jgi:hypothetical protein